MPQELPIPPELAVDVEPFPVAAISRLVDFDEEPETLPPAHREETAAARRWIIDDDALAEWAMRHLAAAEVELDRITDQANDYVARIHAWADQQTKDPASTAAFFRRHLEEYAIRRRAASGDELKTLSLPSGKVSTTYSGPKATIEDAQDPTVIAWVKANVEIKKLDEVVAVTERISLKGLRELVDVFELVVEADVTLSDGHRIRWHEVDVAVWLDTDGKEIGELPGLGDGVRCPECSADVLVGRIDELATRYEVRGPDGRIVPNVAVSPPKVTSSAKPA